MFDMARSIVCRHHRRTGDGPRRPLERSLPGLWQPGATELPVSHMHGVPPCTDGRNTSRRTPGECRADRRVIPFTAPTARLRRTLTATVRHPDPSKDVWAEFSLWHNTTSTQILRLGTPGSRSSTTVKGQGTVSLTVPKLTPGQSYGWRVRTADDTTDDTASPPTATSSTRGLSTAPWASPRTGRRTGVSTSSLLAAEPSVEVTATDLNEARGPGRVDCRPRDRVPHRDTGARGPAVWLTVIAENRRPSVRQGHSAPA